MKNIINRAITGIFIVGLGLASLLVWVGIIEIIIKSTVVGGITLSALLLFAIVAASIIYGGGADSAETTEKDNV